MKRIFFCVSLRVDYKGGPPDEDIDVDLEEEVFEKDAESAGKKALSGAVNKLREKKEEFAELDRALTVRVVGIKDRNGHNHENIVKKFAAASVD